MRIFRVAILLVGVLLPIFISCEAPRSNPLDPENVDNTIGTITGLIQSVSLPRQPLAETSVLWKESNIITETDADGKFQIDKLIPVNGWIVFRKAGYSSDSAFVDWNSRKNISIEAYLNARPVLDSAVFSSIVINKFPTIQKYSIETKVKISDEENDVDSVFLKNEELNFISKLEYNLSSRYYEQTLSLVDLSIESLDEIIGKDFEVIALDVTEEAFTVGFVNLKRIIKEEILLTAPSGKQLVEADSIQFNWSRFTPGFTYSYLFQIYTDETPAELVFEAPLESDKINYIYDAELATGEYFWVMWAVDEFTNQTRSKPASFIVE